MAEPEVFTIDPANSTLTCTGEISVTGLGTFQLATQGTGSLTAAYGGTLRMDVTPTAIMVGQYSQCTAQVSGNWSPLAGGAVGTAPANYGGTVNGGTVDLAVRNAAFYMASGAIPLSGTTFDSSAVLFAFVSSSAMDYLATGFSKSGSRSLNGLYAYNGASSPNGTLVTSGTTQTLTIPVDTTFTTTVISTNDTTFHIVGNLVAKYSTSMQMSVSGNNITLSWDSVVGEKNRIESSGDLNIWDTLNPSLTSTTTLTTYPTVKNGLVRFFRRTSLP